MDSPKIKDLQLPCTRSPSPSGQNPPDFFLLGDMSVILDAVASDSGGFEHVPSEPVLTPESCSYERFFGDALI